MLVHVVSVYMLLCNADTVCSTLSFSNVYLHILEQRLHVHVHVHTYVHYMCIITMYIHVSQFVLFACEAIDLYSTMYKKTGWLAALNHMHLQSTYMYM